MIKKQIIIATFIILNLFLLSFALAGNLPDTGQTKCYDNDQEITCPSPGEPFYGQDAQYGPNLQSYTKLDANGNDLPDEATEWVMVRDNVTGLIWEVKEPSDGTPDYNNPHDADNTYSWYDSDPETNGGNPGTPGDGTDTEDFINVLNTAQFGGYDDWRLPTIKELSTIVDNSSILHYEPTINSDYFPNAVTSHYWSSSTNAESAYSAWVVHFSSGTVSSNGKSASEYVRAVRGVQKTNNFIKNGDGTVTDASTGLMWEVKKSKDGTSNYGNPNDADNVYNWGDALSLSENLILNNDGEWTTNTPNASGAKFDDWRLPNRNELQSLVDYSQSDPSIDIIYFPDTLSSFYSSSTTDVDNRNYACLVRFDVGLVYGRPSKEVGFSVRSVRAGLCGTFGDSDGDTLCDDGDDSGTPGDNTCTGGEKVNCDDNCPNDYNPLQTDCDEDGTGDVCDGDTIDNDGDGIDDGEGVGHGCDNCPNHPNGPARGICTELIAGNYIVSNGQYCVDDTDCDPGEYCEKEQADHYPPGGNGIGDACDCEGDFDCDGGVTSADVGPFLDDWNHRTIYSNPCTNEDPCTGDFNCNGGVGADDVGKFLEDWNHRTIWSNPCPQCSEGPWCVYPE